ncbi:hypothetical protein [Steroidobacter sp.]|uniref:hypothetical protein n=1 Tax=Steroidobacter sp. TaxID=1978227 RepID=UPI001A5266FF|nr:hypothetical protein [Steroidobacter sp.]MBL8271561.1 hypothetical protein [Steroidobacter sp.]
MSSRVLFFLLPLGAVCTMLSTNPKACASLALLVVGLAVTLRWLDRRGVQAVDVGLKSGMLPLLVSIALMQVGCSPNSPLCITICVLGGSLAGVWMGYQLGYGRAGLFVWLATASVALIIAALGSLDVGLVASIGLSTAYIATGAIVAALVRLRAAI